MSKKATTKDKTRTIEAALGKVSTEHTLDLGPWKVGYLSMKNSEARRLDDVQESNKYGVMLDFAYELFKGRFLGDELPSQEEFEDETDVVDVRVFFAWLNGATEEEAREAFSNPIAAARAVRS